jgi:hypothetical protein
MPSLFAIIDQYHDQLSALNDSELPTEVILDTVEAMQGDVETKIRAVVAYALQIKADADTRKAHAKRMADSAKAMESRYESLMMYAQVGVMNSGLKLPMALPEFTLNLAKNPPSLDDALDASKVPTQYLRRTISFSLPAEANPTSFTDKLHEMGINEVTVDVAVDKRPLLEAVKTDPEACKPFAKLNPTSYRLTVR